MLLALTEFFLIVLFVLSIFNQFSFRFLSRLALYDKFLLLPKWTFFAPNPGCEDYRLLYRDFDATEQPSTWQEVCTVRKRTWSDAFWNPNKRLSKALFDLTQSLSIIRKSCDKPAILMTSIPYVALVHYINCLPRGQSVKYRQFMVVQSHGIFADSPPEMLIQSEIHSVAHSDR
jgi:hypothetical protein